jgi:hypothetical protein
MRLSRIAPKSHGTSRKLKLRLPACKHLHRKLAYTDRYQHTRIQFKMAMPTLWMLLNITGACFTKLSARHPMELNCVKTKASVVASLASLGGDRVTTAARALVEVGSDLIWTQSTAACLLPTGPPILRRHPVKHRPPPAMQRHDPVRLRNRAARKALISHGFINLID